MVDPGLELASEETADVQRSLPRAAAQGEQPALDHREQKGSFRQVEVPTVGSPGSRPFEPYISGDRGP